MSLKNQCETLAQQLLEKFGSLILSTQIHVDELTIELASENLSDICYVLRDDPTFHFEMLIDIAGIDYSEYGISEWETTQATTRGFSRGINQDPEIKVLYSDKPRFAVIYHLLSLKHNQRLRIRTFALNEPPIVPSVISIWNSANWFEREAFDLFGILFNGHPDLRRILTDYGFIGHPFRKDFPLIGNVEMRYSAKDGRVIYEPVSIEPRTLTPKTIPIDHRYFVPETKTETAATSATEGKSHG